MMNRVMCIVLGLLAVSAADAEPLEVFRDCGVCPEMIELPPGEFVMGAPDDEFHRNLNFRDGRFQPATAEHPYLKEDEGPQHTVIVDIAIAMGRNEITYAEWMACVDDGGCGGYVPENEIGAQGSIEEITRALTDGRFTHTPSEDAISQALPAGKTLLISGAYPVLNVSYYNAQAYVVWLNRKLGTDAYRLPTEAEWEYAARAGTRTRFAQGDMLTPEQANFSGEATEQVMMQDMLDLRTLGHPVPVDELDAANAWGLRHMSGNAGEITLSCYTERYAGWSTTSEWLDKSFGESCERAVRSGSYAFSMDVARVAWRGSRDESTWSLFDGFRIVKEMK
jgi:formylglycine-generating enzyme required for sulfatase activity